SDVHAALTQPVWSVPCTVTMTSLLLEEMCHLTAQSLSTFEVSDHFRVIKQLGQGSYGKVMLAVHKGKGTPMALKLFRKSNTSKLSFLREYTISLCLSSHPCIIGVFGIVFQSLRLYGFAQEVAIHGDLFEIIVPQVGWWESSARKVLVQLIQALDFLHGKGLVHRDVKPENVLVCVPDCSRVKLSDFGLTKPRGSRIHGTSGPVPYSAPELTISEEEEKAQHGTTPRLLAEPSLDCWALGVLLFCILTGNFPWEKTSCSDPLYREYKTWFDSQETRMTAPTQFSSFTTLALSLFKGLLTPDAKARAAPKEVLQYFGGAWVKDKAREGIELGTKTQSRNSEVAECRPSSFSCAFSHIPPRKAPSSGFGHFAPTFR
uniref:Serine/threonine-protein kinase SBK1-like n=1 Tax=Erpetoichthys calabaricus TaxID=27687 RepID=A0A8C4T418_ERPCA